MSRLSVFDIKSFKNVFGEPNELDIITSFLMLIVLDSFSVGEYEANILNPAGCANFLIIEIKDLGSASP